jgi:dihydrofolate reductase
MKGHRPVGRLKAELGGRPRLASYQLVHTLLESGLVDEVRVIVFPHVLGSGGRLFHDLTRAVPLHLIEVQRVGDELVRLSYEVTPVGSPGV